jgi:hypothetical protein
LILKYCDIKSVKAISGKDPERSWKILKQVQDRVQDRVQDKDLMLTLPSPRLRQASSRTGS